MDATGLSKILEVLKSSTALALAIAFVAGLLLFGPESFVASLGLPELLVTWRPWVGLAFLFCTALLVARATAGFGSWVKKRWTWWIGKRNLIARLHRLAPDEKELLARFLLQRRKCLTFPLQNGVPQGLAAAKVLYRSSNLGDMIDGFDFSMQPWAWEYLNRHPGLVISDPETLQLLMERTVAADRGGFDQGRAPWEEERAPRHRLWRRSQ